MSIYDEMFGDAPVDRENAESFQVEVLRASNKSLLCRFAGGGERWVPLSQMGPLSEVRAPGDKGKLTISSWLASRWEDGQNDAIRGTKEDTWVTKPGMIVLRESVKAISVRAHDWDDDDAVWIPKSQIHPDSPVNGDGDAGDLIITEWIANNKGL